jgi:hypothetical protein
MSYLTDRDPDVRFTAQTEFDRSAAAAGTVGKERLRTGRELLL